MPATEDAIATTLPGQCPQRSARHDRTTSMTTGTTSRQPIGRAVPARKPKSPAHHQFPRRMFTKNATARRMRSASEYPITRTKAGGASIISHTARRASTRSRSSERTSA